MISMKLTKLNPMHSPIKPKNRRDKQNFDRMGMGEKSQKIKPITSNIGNKTDSCCFNVSFVLGGKGRTYKKVHFDKVVFRIL